MLWMLYCFQIWVATWHAEGATVDPGRLGIPAPLESFAAIPVISVMRLAFTGKMNAPLCFLDENNFFFSLSNGQHVARGSKELLPPQDHLVNLYLKSTELPLSCYRQLTYLIEVYLSQATTSAFPGGSYSNVLLLITLRLPPQHSQAQHGRQNPGCTGYVGSPLIFSTFSRSLNPWLLLSWCSC